MENPNADAVRKIFATLGQRDALRLLFTIEELPDWPAAALAEQLDMTKQQTHRTLNRLEAAALIARAGTKSRPCYRVIDPELILKLCEVRDALHQRTR